MPASTLLAKESAAGYTPNVDGAVLPQSIGPALASGQFSHVPVMIGTNHDEWRLFVALDQLIGGPPVSAVNYQTEINDTLGGGLSAAAVAAIAAQYPLSDYSSPSVALGAVGTDAIFACHALTAEQSLASYVPTYAYEFNDSSAPERFLGSVGFPYGAAQRAGAAVPVHPVQHGLPRDADHVPAAARRGHAAGVDEPGRRGRPGRWLAAVQPGQPAVAVPGPVATAARD